jgi:S1-C subfamily serine protease
MGLKVGSVEPGTIAARLGIEAGDIVMDVNGRGIHDVEDVRDVLRQRKPGEDVSVTIVDEAGKHRVLTWRAGNEDKKREERKF